MVSRGGRLTRWYAPALYLLLLAGFAAGIWGSFRAVFPGPGLYRVTGVFEARAADRMILVRHEEIPGLMGEMERMVLFAAGPELLDRARLSPGDRIRFTLRQDGERLIVTEILKIQ